MGYDHANETYFIGADVINLRIYHDEALQIKVYHQTSQGSKIWFGCEIPIAKVVEETNRQAHSPAELKNYIVLAIKKTGGFNIDLEPVTLQDDSGKTTTKEVLLKLSHQPQYALKPQEFVLKLEPIPHSVEHRLDIIEKVVDINTDDRFSDVPSEIHTGLATFNDRRMIVKKKDAPPTQHLSASTGVSFSSGRHFMVFRILRCANNYCLVGVQHQLGVLTPYPGHATFPTGKALNGNNGLLYANSTHNNYNIGGFGVGDYVGVLLDMDRKKLSFTINGIKGDEVDVSESSYYFIVTVYSNYDAVKIVPRYCWHNKY
eukprot:TRINITY_DN394_c0_g2_i1.p1 TRINITY_DN394_c0_g2~~TRINITY_DN394_c0_g2_i1.p1  ORF type:complete len:316 (+),score=44.21 TRINITY_DN394_c0_g2_i1:118-1065(+)